MKDYITKIKDAERRFFSPDVELRAAEEGKASRTIDGLGIVYNRLSENFAPYMDGGLYEVIEPGSAAHLLDDENIMILDNHMSERVLARNKNTAQLTDTDEGVRYLFEAPKTTIGEDMLENVRLKNIRKSSFAFLVSQQGMRVERGIKWEGMEGKINVRRIVKFDQLLDFSPVTYPAYTDSSVAKRCLEGILKEQEREAKKYLISLLTMQKELLQQD